MSSSDEVNLPAKNATTHKETVASDDQPTNLDSAQAYQDYLDADETLSPEQKAQLIKLFEIRYQRQLAENHAFPESFQRPRYTEMLTAMQSCHQMGIGPAIFRQALIAGINAGNETYRNERNSRLRELHDICYQRKLAENQELPADLSRPRYQDLEVAMRACSRVGIESSKISQTMQNAYNAADQATAKNDLI